MVVVVVVVAMAAVAAAAQCRAAHLIVLGSFVSSSQCAIPTHTHTCNISNRTNQTTSSEGARRLVVGGWWLVVGGWWLVVGGWWVVGGGWRLMFRGWWLTGGKQ